ncbi:hypothetical protein CLAIMM_09922 isoform 2 [Cladophialophora immunda]|nr:hypothetical protein CLAIMM_09922 isoform 1 [Cladophialophora immunda]OQV05136.1 hypothetical protein CLAIMM_09922 isoform 2 [Cladophialophora immunda]
MLVENAEGKAKPRRLFMRGDIKPSRSLSWKWLYVFVASTLSRPQAPSTVPMVFPTSGLPTSTVHYPNRESMHGMEKESLRWGFSGTWSTLTTAEDLDHSRALAYDGPSPHMRCRPTKSGSSLHEKQPS